MYEICITSNDESEYASYESQKTFFHHVSRIHSVYTELEKKEKERRHSTWEIQAILIFWGSESTVDHIVQYLSIPEALFHIEKYFHVIFGIISYHKTNVLCSHLHTFVRHYNTYRKTDNDC